MTTRFTRRDALKVGAAGSLGYFFTGPAASAAKAYGAIDKVRFACVGIGGKGSGDSGHVANLGEIVAICDIDEKFIAARKAGRGAQAFEKAKVFHDYRKLFDDAVMKDVDAVTVSTPDHHHATVALSAMRMKKHVYVQKPMCQTVQEARLMREAARKYGVCTQMGNQGTASNGIRRAAELVQDGVIGDVKEVHIWTNRPVWPQSPEVTPEKMPKETPVPTHVHWEEFIGPAPMRAYAIYDQTVPRRYGGRTGAYHDFHWRGWWDFGTGAIGDMACHTANLAFMALKLTTPTHVTAVAGDVNPQTCPSYAHVTSQFAARGTMPALTLHWYEGSKDGKLVHPPAELVEKAVALYKGKTPTGLVNSGSILIGSKGMLYSPDDYGSNFHLGGGDFSKVNRTTPERTTKNNQDDQGQKNEWVQAIKENKHTLAFSNFDYASYLTESFLLGNVAIRSGKAFGYDGETGMLSGPPDAAAFLKYNRRKGWDRVGDKA